MNRFFSINLLASIGFFILFTNAIHAQFTQELARTYNGNGDFSDKFTCITRDAAGNVYAAGSSIVTSNSRDFLLVKYNNSGVQQWARTLDGTGNGADEATAIWVDASGNVYATGYQKGVNAGNDFLTVKYNSAGVLQWSQIYNSLYNEVDQGNSITVDAAGDVLVTGQSDRDVSTTTNDDYVTVKYNGATGAQIWEQRFNGAGNNVDRPAKVLCDAANNVYVTGRSSNGSNDDYVTIKYNAAGVQQWLKIEDRTGNDRAADMCFDPSGNIIVVGRSKVANYDYYTVKYDAAGVKLWALAYNNLDDDRATCVTTDALGNIYVGGQSDTNANTATNIYDFRIVKYTSAGTLVWTQAYSSPTTDDIPYSIATDGTNVVLGGESANAAAVKDMLIAGFNASTGVVAFNKNYDGAAAKNDVANAMTIDAAGNVFAAGFTENALGQRNATLVKWNNTGTQQAATFYNGAGDNSDNVRAIYVDATGNTYLAGYSINFNTDRDFKITKINPAGDTLWTRLINGTSSWSSDEAVAITADAAGNIYATGWAKNSSLGYDIVVVKFTSAGVQSWVTQFDNGVRQNDKAVAIAIAPNGNVIVAGKTDADATNITNDNLLLAAFNAATGANLWKKTYNGTATNGGDRATHLQIATSGNIYVGGKTWNGVDDDVVLQKYNATGILQWTQIYATAASDDINDMKIDAAENVYVAGSALTATTEDGFLLKYDAAGVQQWAKIYDNSVTPNSLNYFNNVLIDATGNVYAIGSANSNLASGTFAAYDFNMVKYNSAGTKIFDKFFNISESDYAANAAFDANGYIVLTGETNVSDVVGTSKITTVVIDNTGALRESISYDSPVMGVDAPTCMTIANGKVYVAGYTSPSLLEKDQLLLRYAYIVATENAPNQAKTLTIVSPNPCTNYFTIENELFNVNTVKNIELCSVVGASVPVSISQNGTQIKVELPANLPSGTYFISSKTNEFVTMRIVRL